MTEQPLRTPERPWTRGPWGWFGSRRHHYYLATNHSGRFTVMSFRRKGMTSAQPVFQQDQRLVPADDLCIFEVCRDAASHKDERVYRQDIVGFRNADAQLIAAAPEIAEEALFLLDRLREWANDHLTDDNSRDWDGHVEPSLARLRMALQKAGAKL
jgi:hypothetical protein